MLGVLQWIVGRVNGTAKADVSPIGLVPAEGALDLGGLDLPGESLRELFHVDRDGWLAEVKERDELFQSFVDRAPQALVAAHAALRKPRRALGVRVFGRPDLLHHLGQAVVWRDAVIAGCRTHASPAWQRTLCREGCAARRAGDRRMHAADDLAEILS